MKTNARTLFSRTFSNALEPARMIVEVLQQLASQDEFFEASSSLEIFAGQNGVSDTSRMELIIWQFPKPGSQRNYTALTVRQEPISSHP